jgi:hypothetical protein
MMALRIAALIAFAAALSCFNPTFKQDIACGQGNSCPPGLTCTDGICRSGGGGGSGVIDAAEIPDAPVDAPTVACTNDDACQTPPTKCQKPGTCDTKTGFCNFGSVDCSSMATDCSTAACNPDTGACVVTPKDNNTTCGTGKMCGNFGACDYTGDCDSTAKRTRSCTTHTCQSGTCVAGTATEEEPCTRVTEDVQCNNDEVKNCGACDYANMCDESASQNCTCTSFKCKSDQCTATTPRTCAVGCSRDTDNLTCGTSDTTNCTACAFTDTCDESAPNRTCSCNDYKCSAGTCATISRSCSQTCSRNTDGASCDCTMCLGDPPGRVVKCVNGACTGTGATCGTCTPGA